MCCAQRYAGLRWVNGLTSGWVVPGWGGEPWEAGIVLVDGSNQPNKNLSNHFPIPLSSDFVPPPLMLVSRALSSIALRVSRSPIESIVGVFVLTTLAYFHVLAAVKQSNFLQPGPAIPEAQQPALALRRSVSPEWISLSVDAPYAPRLELLPVVLPPQAVDRANVVHFLTNELTAQNGQKYPQLCFSINASCVTDVNALTLAFSPGATPLYLHALTASVLPPAQDGTHLKVVQSVETIMDMRSGRWIAYAGRALVLRFWNLAKVGNSRPRSHPPNLSANRGTAC